MAKVLITGGGGFVGSHLAEYLLKQGDAVFVIDDLSTGSIKNIAHLKKHPRFHYTVDTILHKSVLAELIDRVNVIYHLAASVGVKLIMERLVESIENNFKGTENVLALASRKRKKVLVTSTSEVYGRGNRETFAEEDDLMMGPTTKGRWSYACGKAMDEYLSFAYAHEFGVPVTVVRLFNTVGERQSDAYGMVVPTFIRQALAGEPLTIYGDGEQSRCFAHVEDVVWALHQLMEHPDSTNQIYNIGSTENITINQLADKVIDLTGSRSQKVYVPYEKAYGGHVHYEDIARRVPDISKVQELIGFQPTKSLQQIIERMRDYELAQIKPSESLAIPEPEIA